MGKHSPRLLTKFFILCFFTALGIFLHEVGHHLFGVKSMLSFSRNWPLVPLTQENISIGIIGTIAGPSMNIFFAYLGLFLYKYGKKNNPTGTFGWYWGLVNSFIALSGAIINLIVDYISGTMGNDLEVASRLLNINILLLPVMFTLISIYPFVIFSHDYQKIAPNKSVFIFMIFGGWLLGGLSLLLLDSIFTIRFHII